MPVPHISRFSPVEQAKNLRWLPEPMLRCDLLDFAKWAFPGQLPSAGDWRTWVLMVGRGGKGLRIALAAAKIDEARAVMMEGPSGILTYAGPGKIADWQPSLRLLRFCSGAAARADHQQPARRVPSAGADPRRGGYRGERGTYDGRASNGYRGPRELRA